MTRKGKGISPKLFRKAAIREFVDHDYLDKLSPEELEWLKRFDLSYYNGEGSAAFTSDKQRRDRVNELNAYNASQPSADAFAVSRVMGRLDHPDTPADWEAIGFSPDQEWVTRSESPEFKAARARARLVTPNPPPRRNGKPEMTAELREARKALVDVNQKELASLSDDD